MHYDKTIYKSVAQAFRERKAAAKRQQDSRREEIYARFPEVKEIDDKLASTAFSMYQSIIGGMDAEEAIHKISLLDNKLVREKEDILVQNGYPKDYLSPQYQCARCKDEGYIGATMCTCYQNALIAEAFAQSNLAALQEQTFDKFDLRYYPKEKLALDKSGDALSPYEIMQGIVKRCKDFVTHFDTRQENLLFYGPPGLGKTFLSSCIANELLKGGKTVLYQSANSIFSTLDSLRFGRNVKEQQRYAAERVNDVDLLIIDDLGTEFSTDFSVAELFRIVNTRLLGGTKTIISTNLTIPDLKNAYSERLLSRILGSYTIMRFVGKDIRLQKKYESNK